MDWDLKEALDYYRTQGAPGNQNALIELLREIQQEHGGGIPAWALLQMAKTYGVRESYLNAIVRRIPSLRLENTHCLELCCGPNCRKQAELAAFVESVYGSKPEKFTVKYSGCMRMCGKGPNLKWDGQLYHQADQKLIRRLVAEINSSAKKA